MGIGLGCHISPYTNLSPRIQDDTHDELISAEEIVKSGRMSQEDWDVRTYCTLYHHAKRHRDLHQPPPCMYPRKHTQLCSKYAQALFRHGQKVAESRGLILVDTKYEFGKVSPSHRLLMQDVCFLG